ncbi:hypothetical protein MASR1M32_32090 [Rhodobacter sp.]
MAGLRPAVAVPKAEDRGARRPRQGRGKGRVVQMGVGDKDDGNPLAGVESGENGLQVALKGGTGVDHRHLARADDVGPGPRPGHRRGVPGQNPPQPAGQGGRRRRGLSNRHGHG